MPFNYTYILAEKTYNDKELHVAIIKSLWHIGIITMNKIRHLGKTVFSLVFIVIILML